MTRFLVPGGLPEEVTLELNNQKKKALGSPGSEAFQGREQQVQVSRA